MPRGPKRRRRRDVGRTNRGARRDTRTCGRRSASTIVRGLDLSAGQHAEQRLVRRRAKRQQSLRRIDRVPRREERQSASGTSRPCITGCGTTTFPRRPCSRRCTSTGARATSSPCRRRRAFSSCSIAWTASRSGRSRSAPCRRATCPARRRRSRSRFRRSRKPFAKQGFSFNDLIDFTPEIRVARARGDQGLSRRAAVHAAVDATERSSCRARSAAQGGAAARSIRRRARSTSRRRISRRCTRSCKPTRSDSLDADYTVDLGAQSLRVSIPSRDSTPARPPLPINKPPYGTLVAIDLNTGDQKWNVTLGDTPAIRNHPLLKVLQSAAARRRRLAGADRHRGRVDLRDRRRLDAVCDRHAERIDTLVSGPRTERLRGADDLSDKGGKTVRRHRRPARRTGKLKAS